MKQMPRTTMFETFAINGMDLRDYFAAKAMQGIMSKEHYDGTYESVAKYAYKCADEMMKARLK